MVILPGNIWLAKTTELLEEKTIENLPRKYLGMSQLGHSCSRYLWYYFRWAFKDSYNVRIQRIFRRGHLAEADVIEDLESIGIEVNSESVSLTAGHGHIGGHNDGTCINVPEAPKTKHVLEIKCLKNSKFNEMKKKKVKEANFTYYIQCQLYMHFMELKRTLFVVRNADTMHYYTERIKYNKDEAKEYLDRGVSVVMSEDPPIKMFDKTWYECKWCPAREVCHFNGKVEKTCRTCVYADIHVKGEWKCAKHGHTLSEQQQKDACDDYSAII